MSKLRHFDYLIIGQGLAGSILAWYLIGVGKKVLVIDNARPTAASRVAAGLINPVTGKRLVKDIKVELFLAAAIECYQSMAEILNREFIFDIPMLRLFNSDDIKQNWQKRSADGQYRNFIGKEINEGEYGYQCGGFLQKQTGYLASKQLLGCLRHWLEEQNSYLCYDFDYSGLDVQDVIKWKEYTADCVIFCEGAMVSKNPWFNYLPMQPSQGEILSLKTDQPLPQWIVNGGKWLLPLGEGKFKLGATYVWPTETKPLDETITDSGRQELLESLPKLFPGLSDYSIVKHEVGIRPNSLDKKPLIGFHPSYSNLAVFNGFGSRGSLLIPYYARHFSEVLMSGIQLDENVDIKRIHGTEADINPSGA